MVSKVEPEQVELAINALLNFVSKQADTKALLEDEEFVHVVVALKKIPEKARVKPFRIRLKHSLYADKSLCLFTKDDSGKNFKQILEENPVEGIDKIIPVSKLRKNYRQFKDRRDLLATYDMFLADNRVIPSLPALLGKKFFEKKKQPVAVNLNKKDISSELKLARDSTYFFLPSGPSCMVKMGLTSFSRTQLLENIMGALDNIVKNIPKKWKNVQALYLRTASSVALPFYNSLPSSTRIAVPSLADSSTTPNKKRKRKGLSAPMPGVEADEADDEVMEEEQKQEEAAPVLKKSKVLKSKTPLKSKTSTVKKTTAAKKTPAGAKTKAKTASTKKKKPASTKK